MKKRILSLLLALALLLPLLPQSALTATAATYSGTCGDNLTWSFNSDTGALVISGSGPMWDYSSSDNAPWYRRNITSVQISDSVTTIGNRAFYSCDSLPSVTIPDSVTTIGDSAFYSCGRLTSVTIGDSVTTIGDSAFYFCGSLTSVTIGDSVTTIGKYAFSSCGSLTSVTIGDSVTTIGKYAFSYCDSLTSVTIGDSVTTIGNCAFDSCDSLTSVTIPDSVTTIGYNAFYNCDSLTGIWVDEGNPNYSSDENGVLFSKDKTTLIQCSGAYSGDYTIPDSVTTIGDSAFDSCDSLTSVTIGDSVTTIGKKAFYNCYSLTSVTIGDSVTTIGCYAFESCYSLTSVTIGDSVTTIGSYAFSNCDGLTSVTIPDSVTTIGWKAFTYCYSLTSIWVDEGNPNYSSDKNGVLFSKDKTTLIQCPGAYSGDYTIPDSVKTIGEDAFSYCYSLTSVTIPDSVTTIDNDAFRNCDSLTSVTIPDSVKTIGYNAFDSCDSLTSVTILNPDCSICNSSGMLGKVGIATICGYSGSTAQNYAERYGYKFRAICDIHTLSYTAEAAPTCTTDGNLAYWHCNVCNLYFSDAETTQVICFDQIILPSSGHSWDNGVVTLQPTCTDTGILTYTCASCAATKTETLPATDHDFDDNGECASCGCATITVSMHDVFGDGWTENKILVYEDGALFKELTLQDGLDATVSFERQICKKYSFVWQKGTQTNECSFEISKEAKTLYTAGTSSAPADGETFLEFIDHRFVDGVCTCGETQNTDPIPDENLKFTMNISVGAAMSVSYNVMASAVNKYDDFYLEVSKANADGDPTVVTYGLSEGHEQMNNLMDFIYSATYEGISAKQMGDEFSTTLYAIDENGKLYKGETVTESIKDYLVTKASEENATDEFKTMAVDMLKYGAEAQNIFSYGTDNLVTADLSEDLLSYATVKTPEATDISATSGNGVAITANVTVGSKVELGLSIFKTGLASPETVRCEIRDADGKLIAEPTVANAMNMMFSAGYSEVGAREMRKPITATFYMGDEQISQTVTWSVESYVAQVRTNASSTENDIAMVNAMLTYGDSVGKYLTSIGQ